jgi:hypothetical protein
MGAKNLHAGRMEMSKQPSYATARKVRIIESRLGAGWQGQRPNQSIDAVYNELVGDTRKNLFCKIDPTVKSKLDEMTGYYDVKMAEFVENLIDKEYDTYMKEKREKLNALAQEFSGR